MALLNRRNSAVFAKWRRYTAVLNQNLDLGRLKECWDVAYALNSAEVWQRLGAFQYNCFVFLPARHRENLRVLLMAATAAMETLDIELALRIYRQQGDAAMVLVHWQGPWGWGRVCGCNTAPLNVSLMLALSWLFTSRHASSAVQSLERAARS